MVKQWKQELAVKTNRGFKRNIFIDIKDRATLDKVFRQEGEIDCYRSIYAYDNIEDIDNSLIYGPLAFDLDMDFKTPMDYAKLLQDFNTLIILLYEELGLTEDEYKVYFSGSKGFHILVDPRVLGIRPLKELNYFYRLLAESLKDKMKYGTLDTSIYDKRRVLRANNTINSKTGLYKIELTIDEINSLHPKEIGKKAQYKREPIVKRHRGLNRKARAYFASIVSKVIRDREKKQEMMDKRNDKLTGNIPITPCILALVEDKDIKGERNNRCHILSSILLQKGAKEDKLYDYMEAWNQSLIEPMKDYELRTTVKSSIRMYRENKYYGCSSLKDISCNKECPLYSE